MAAPTSFPATLSRLREERNLLLEFIIDSELGKALCQYNAADKIAYDDISIPSLLSSLKSNTPYSIPTIPSSATHKQRQRAVEWALHVVGSGVGQQSVEPSTVVSSAALSSTAPPAPCNAPQQAIQHAGSITDIKELWSILLDPVQQRFAAFETVVVCGHVVSNPALFPALVSLLEALRPQLGISRRRQKLLMDGMCVAENRLDAAASEGSLVYQCWLLVDKKEDDPLWPSLELYVAWRNRRLGIVSLGLHSLVHSNSLSPPSLAHVDQLCLDIIRCPCDTLNALLPTHTMIAVLCKTVESFVAAGKGQATASPFDLPEEAVVSSSSVLLNVVPPLSTVLAEGMMYGLFLEEEAASCTPLTDTTAHMHTLLGCDVMREWGLSPTHIVHAATIISFRMWSKGPALSEWPSFVKPLCAELQQGTDANGYPLAVWMTILTTLRTGLLNGSWLAVLPRDDESEQPCVLPSSLQAWLQCYQWCWNTACEHYQQLHNQTLPSSPAFSGALSPSLHPSFLPLSATLFRDQRSCTDDMLEMVQCVMVHGYDLYRTAEVPVSSDADPALTIPGIQSLVHHLLEFSVDAQEMLGIWGEVAGDNSGQTMLRTAMDALLGLFKGDVAIVLGSQDALTPEVVQTIALVHALWCKWANSVEAMATADVVTPLCEFIEPIILLWLEKVRAELQSCIDGALLNDTWAPLSQQACHSTSPVDLFSFVNQNLATWAEVAEALGHSLPVSPSTPVPSLLRWSGDLMRIFRKGVEQYIAVVEYNMGDANGLAAALLPLFEPAPSSTPSRRPLPPSPTRRKKGIAQPSPLTDPLVYRAHQHSLQKLLVYYNNVSYTEAKWKAVQLAAGGAVDTSIDFSSVEARMRSFVCCWIVMVKNGPTIFEKLYNPHPKRALRLPPILEQLAEAMRTIEQHVEERCSLLMAESLCRWLCEALWLVFLSRTPSPPPFLSHPLNDEECISEDLQSLCDMFLARDEYGKPQGLPTSTLDRLVSPLHTLLPLLEQPSEELIALFPMAPPSCHLSYPVDEGKKVDISQAMIGQVLCGREEKESKKFCKRMKW